MRNFIATLLSAAVLLSCNNSKPENDLSIVPANSSNTNTATTGDTLAKQMPATSNDYISATNLETVKPAAAVNIGTGLNPEHGKPGHRCDLQVGAPLSSAPIRVATKPSSISAPTIPTNTTSKTVTAKGMNPAHGEPGHRCDISVGAPLNSPVKAATNGATGSANITPMNAPGQSNAIVSALQNTSISTSSNASTASSGKINPAHGQPGHDCKVAVGQPLP